MPNLKEVQAIAKDMGIKTTGLKKGDLILAIQKAEGNFPCFKCEGCKENCHEENCAWRKDCFSDK